MKLIMENWRRYLTEQEASWGDWTIEELEDLIKNAREEENVQAKKWLGKTMGIEFIKLIPVLGHALTGGEVLSGLYKKHKRSEAESDDNPEDFPILDILVVDPYLIQTLDQEILNSIDEEYEKYLHGLPAGTRIKDITDINDFIRGIVARQTKKHVTIVDQSGEG